MDRKKEILKKLEILNKNLPELEKELEKGPRNYNVHSKAAGEIGKIVGKHDDAWNQDVYLGAESYINNELNQNVNKYYSKDKEVQEAFNKTKKNLNGVYKLMTFGKRKTIESNVMTGILTLSIIAGIFFLSPNITGNIIGNITKNTSNFLGIILFVLGICGLLVYKKCRK